MTTMRSVTAYCSSSSAVARHFVDAATEAGRAIAENGWTLVYGGNPLGLMKALSDGAQSLHFEAFTCLLEALQRLAEPLGKTIN